MSVSSSDSDRYSFRIKFDKYVDGQNFNGLNEFVLNNNFQDPSYMREYLSYKALENLGVDVPKNSYANVYINGELFGFYLAVEAIDDSFVKRITNTNSNDVKLYKADGDNSTLVDEASLSNFELKSGKDDNMDGLKKLVSAINSIENSNKGDIESIFDVDTFLKSIAVNTVVGNYDSYNGSKAHNYFLLEEDGVFKYIPWDYNMAFGGFMGDNGKSITVSIDKPIYGVESSKRPLIEKLLSVDEYNKKYQGYLKELVTYFDDFENQVNEVATLIRPYVKSDPSAFYTIEQFEKNIVASGTDLSTVENKMGDNRLSKGDNNGEPPAMPDGKMPNFKDFGAPPNNANGEFPSMPDGMKMPSDKNFGNGNPPSRPEGGKMPDMGPGMSISSDVVSIMDYLKQRVENIKTQLS